MDSQLEFSQFAYSQVANSCCFFAVCRVAVCNFTFCSFAGCHLAVVGSTGCIFTVGSFTVGSFAVCNSTFLGSTRLVFTICGCQHSISQHAIPSLQTHSLQFHMHVVEHALATICRFGVGGFQRSKAFGVPSFNFMDFDTDSKRNASDSIRECR